MGQISSTSLIAASKQNLIDEVRSLLNFGINVDTLNDQGNSALHVACFAGHHQVSELSADPSPAPQHRNPEPQSSCSFTVPATTFEFATKTTFEFATLLAFLGRASAAAA
jgi:ankyrin repeat protein